MRALVYQPHHPGQLAFVEVPEPVPTSSQALVQVHAVSLNFGEVAFLSEMRRPGEVPGWDAAGVVLRAAADGSGPKAGARIVGFGRGGAWAERRAIDVSELAVVPDGVDLGAASALPVAGVTALRALRALGPIVGRRVLVTGASGGVGRFAVQLARRAGATVIASVGSERRDEGLRALGADEIVLGVEGLGLPVFGVLDNVGGPLLAQAFALIERGGSLQSIGMASREPSTIDFESERRRAGQRKIEVFAVGDRFGGDIAYLLGLLELGKLDPSIGWRSGWDRIEPAADALLARQVAGKAVLDVRAQEVR
ncbi:MAG: zinc-binding dehydrogenase [Deltaproteobacteria bacterium]